MNGWNRTAMTEMTFNDDSQTYEYEIEKEAIDLYFAFATYQQTAEEADADTDWSVFNSTYRYAIAAGDQEVTTGTQYDLIKVNGTLKLTGSAGTYKVSVTTDMKCTITYTTGISGIKVDGDVSNDIFSDGKPVYNLSGQRVFKGYKGIVIKNGKKIVVK